MEISNPRRILVLGPPDSAALQVLKDLTGSAPEPHDSSIAGLTHTWNLKTQYYSANINIWIDEIPNISTWAAEFSKEEAREVIEAVGAWIYIFRKPITTADVEEIKETMKAVRGVIGEYSEGTCVALGTRQSITTSMKLEGEEWEDFCMELGFEYVDADADGKGRNEYGEMVGIDRLREVMETTEWEGDGPAGLAGLDEDGDFDLEAGWEGLAGEQAEMNIELLGMKTAIHGRDLGEGGDEEKVEEMAKMMSRLMAIKDTTAGMPEQERKIFAARAVNDFMKDV